MIRAALGDALGWDTSAKRALGPVPLSHLFSSFEKTIHQPEVRVNPYSHADDYEQWAGRSDNRRTACYPFTHG